MNLPIRNPSLLYAVLALSIAVNVVMVVRHRSPDAPLSPETAVETTASPAPAAPDAPPAVALKADALPAAGVEPPSAQPMTIASRSIGWTVLRGNVEQSLARTFQLSAGPDGDALASVYTRLFVWDLDLRRDVHAGDAVAVAWRKGTDGLPEIAAAGFQSAKLGRNVTAYRWQAPGDRYPSYWHPDGTEAPLRLKDGPLHEYEQITSLLKDRPTHKGMDFKTPLGTEVHSPRAGTVTRVNWNWGANGNCVEVRYDDGVLAKFLHLSENRVTEGQRVAANQVIALTGNTGHTTAPHLHYQLDRDTRTLDPLDYHGTIRRTLDADQIAALRRDVASFETMIGEAVAR